VSGAPDPKSRTLARGERRYRRKVASPKQWQAIIAAKTGPCRVCARPTSNGFDFGKVEFHHLIARAQGGDDVEDNIVPLHSGCHAAVTERIGPALIRLGESLSDAEYAYVVSKLGEGGLERLFGGGWGSR
jgi:5-methylcytosine-specific restriction endonuclease McrA